MAFLSRLCETGRTFWHRRLYRVVSLLNRKLGFKLPVGSRFLWKIGIVSEVDYWDYYFHKQGVPWEAPYQDRLDPDLPLQRRVAALLPPQTDIRILDVGAGPLTCLGKKCPGKRISITAIDPLADDYDRLLAKYQIRPVVRTRKLAAEEVSRMFRPDTFDLVFARNSIDHGYDPEKAIVNMIEVVKRGCYVLLEHKQNEAETQRYTGLHQWNFCLNANGDFLIRSKVREINFTRRYADRVKIASEMVSAAGASEVIIRMQKRT